MLDAILTTCELLEQSSDHTWSFIMTCVLSVNSFSPREKHPMDNYNFRNMVTILCWFEGYIQTCFEESTLMSFITSPEGRDQILISPAQRIEHVVWKSLEGLLDCVCIHPRLDRLLWQWPRCGADGLENASPFNIWLLWVSMLNFRGALHLSSEIPEVLIQRQATCRLTGFWMCWRSKSDDAFLLASLWVAMWED